MNKDKIRIQMFGWVIGFIFGMALIAASLNAFADEPPTGVIVDGQGAVTLTWTHPGTYTDDSALDPADIAGYAIHWGSSRFDENGDLRQDCAAKPESTPLETTCYGNTIDLSGGAASSGSFTLPLAGDGTVYFAVILYLETRPWADPVSDDWTNYSPEAAKIFTLSTETRVPSDIVEINVNVTVTCTTSEPSVSCDFTVTDPVE